MDNWYYTEDSNYTAKMEEIFKDDTIFIMTSSFLIFTMQSGFGLLESGSASTKDEVNIMVKNIIDVVFGGLSYWLLGFGFSFGDDKRFENGFIGIGRFAYDPDAQDVEAHLEGWNYAAFLFQLSFATTASSIASGAMAERIRLNAHIIFSMVVVLIHAVTAHWVWAPSGFLNKMGVVDVAGCSVVHLVGGVIGFVATVYLRPRRNRFGAHGVHSISSPTNAILGTMMLWWGWLSFNTGSTWGNTGNRWRLASKSAVSTMLSSFAGGISGTFVSYVTTRKCQVMLLIDAVLAGLVSITAISAIARPWESLLIGAIGSALAIISVPMAENLRIDDPVGIIPVHVVAPIWGMIAVGIFAQEDPVIPITKGQYGLIYSGSFKLLGVQAVATLAVVLWSGLLGLIFLMLLHRSPFGLRMTDKEEAMGADWLEHALHGRNVSGYEVEQEVNQRSNVLQGLKSVFDFGWWNRRHPPVVIEPDSPEFELQANGGSLRPASQLRSISAAALLSLHTPSQSASATGSMLTENTSISCPLSPSRFKLQPA
uniref:Ammonium transporter n=1 Tax=Plectus sambesii TaxID=2011161 RepID=A0A914WPD4_9BILA